MPTSTTNYGLIKPGTDDPILIEQLNDNADTIDEALKDNVDAIESKQDALTTFQLAAVNSGIDSAKVAQIAANTSDITLLRTFMAYVGYAEVSKVEKQTDNPSRIKFYVKSYYTTTTSIKTGILAARSLPIDTDLTTDNCEGDFYATTSFTFSTIINDSRNDGLGIAVKPYIEIDGVRHYGVQQRYFYNNL